MGGDPGALDGFGEGDGTERLAGGGGAETEDGEVEAGAAEEALLHGRVDGVLKSGWSLDQPMKRGRRWRR